MKYLIILFMLPLLISAAPAPAPVVLLPAVVRIAPQLQSAMRAACIADCTAQSAIPRQQPACTEQLARQAGAAYLHEIIADARGYPIGEVAAWSCAGDVAATIAEFQQRKATMIGGVR